MQHYNTYLYPPKKTSIIFISCWSCQQYKTTETFIRKGYQQAATIAHCARKAVKERCFQSFATCARRAFFGTIEYTDSRGTPFVASAGGFFQNPENNREKRVIPVNRPATHTINRRKKRCPFYPSKI